MPLLKLNGHFAVEISRFEPRVHKLSIWKQLFHERFWHDPHPELISVHPCFQEHSRPENSDPNLSDLSMPTSPPPWIQAWRRIVHLLVSVELMALRWMSKVVTLGLESRDWLSLRETEHQRDVDKLMARMKREPIKTPADCTHPEWKRHGNKHGSYATCTLCHTRVKWSVDNQAWEASAGWSSSQRSSLPLPSSSNILQQASSSGPKATTSKSKARPKGPPVTPLPEPPISRSSRMGSSRPSTNLGAYAHQAHQVTIYSDPGDDFPETMSIFTQEEEEEYDWVWMEHSRRMQEMMDGAHPGPLN